ncbi:MAG: ferritin-like domain-containing protein [Myxococcota bacterium]
MKRIRSLKPLFKRILRVSLPAAIPLATVGLGCDTEDIFDEVIPAQELFSEEELKTFCGELDFQDCTRVCAEVLPRLNPGVATHSNEEVTMYDVADISGPLNELCGGISSECSVVDCLPQPDRQLRLTCSCSYDAGRRPVGLASKGVVYGESEVGCWLASMAHLEAASIYAFAHLARELKALGAPYRLIEQAYAAARDEVVHAALVGALAVRYGAAPALPEVTPMEVRGRFTLALENATEGCVRESFAALMAAWQAHHAQDPQVRAVMSTIARDETRHGQLALDIDSWLRPLLTEEQRRHLDRARHTAFEELTAHLPSTEPSFHHTLGLPTADHHRLLVHHFREGLV